MSLAPPRDRDLWLRLGLGIAVVVLVAAVFAQSRSFEFLRFDDQTYVSKNPDVASGLSARSVAWAFTTDRAANWHPLTWLSHMADVEMFGMRPAGHHLVNVAIHAVTTLLPFSFLLRLVVSPWTAASLAALWAIHPLRCESVVWVAERKDVLSGLFWMATVLAWCRYGEGRRPRVAYGLALTWFLAGLLAKPMLVTFLVQQGGGAVARIEQVPAALRIENAIVAVPTYLLRTLWPERLAAFYPFDPMLPGWKVAGAAAFVALVTGAAIVLRRRVPFLATGWGWFLVSLVPVAGLVQIGFQATADRYTYVPSIGLIVLLAGAAHRIETTRPAAGRATAVAFAAAVVPLALLTRAKPDYAPAYYNLGLAREKQGRDPEAAAAYQRSLKLEPENRDGQANLARVLARLAEVKR